MTRLDCTMDRVTNREAPREATQDEDREPDRHGNWPGRRTGRAGVIDAPQPLSQPLTSQIKSEIVVQANGRGVRVRGQLCCECRLHGILVLDGKRLPAGSCWLSQSSRDITLFWTADDGTLQARELSPRTLRQLVSEGLLERHRTP